uniref:Uncharacterized protein n=1 Tax=Solanum lycopersicum TaxID=4081 RepID=K4CKZ3_SOLLC
MCYIFSLICQFSSLTKPEIPATPPFCHDSFSHSILVLEELKGGTVWDLVPISSKAAINPHQCGGFEFTWNNIAGDIKIERM